jgi:hypothetical protein
LNQITPIKIADAEYILPSDESVNVIFRASPFEVDVEKFTVSSGVSIAEIINVCFPDGNAPKSFILATIDGHEVYREHWNKVRVKSGRTVNIVVVPRKNALKQVLSVVVAVVAVVIAPALAAPLLSGLGLATGSVAATAITGVIASGLSLAGSLAVNALFPAANNGIEQASSSVEDQTNPLYSIGGAQNTSSPYGAIPVIFGTHRFSPFYAAKTYTEIAGDDQYLRLLFCVGYGEIDLSDLKIGETAISNYEGISVEILQNHLVNAPTLYTKPVYEEQLSIDLSGADWSQRTTADDVDEISVDISFPNGVYRFQKSDGNKVNYTVTVETQYRPVGTTNWLPMSDIVITSSSTQPYRRSVNVAVANGQYEVRVRKTAVDYVGEDTVAEGTFWTALRARRNDTVVKFNKPLTLVAMRVKASNELSSVINTFNVIARPKILSWNGSSWVAGQYTENPADHFRHVLQSDSNARSVPDEQIDLTSLQEWHDYCVANGFTFNFVQDERQSVYATLQMIASAGRAAVSQRDGKWGVVWDADDDLIVQHFTPRNSSDFESTRAYLDMPHGFRVSFINKDNNYLSDERTVYADGYSESNATEFEGLSFAGVTDPNLIWKHGRYHLAQLLLQREAYQLVTDFENLVCTRGDRVRVNHDVTLWGIGAGRVKAVTASPDSVTIDDTFAMESGKTYSMRFRLSDGSSLERTIIGIDGEHQTFALEGSDALPVIGDLAMFGEVNAETVVLRVKSIQPRADLTALLELVDDAPEIKNADQGVIPAFETNITNPTDYSAEQPRNIQIQEILQSTVPARSKFTVTWQAPENGVPLSYSIQISKTGSDNWSPAVTTAFTNYTFFDLEAGAYTVRIAAVYAHGQVSSFASLSQASEIFATQPEDVSDFKISVLSSNATLSWLATTNPAISHYQVRFSPLLVGANWSSAAILRDNVSVNFVDVPVLVGTYFVKAVTYSDLYSLNAVAVVNSIDPANVLNVIDHVEDAPKFNGVKDKTVSSDGYLSLAYQGDIFSIGDIFSVSDIFMDYGGVEPLGYYYFESTFDLGAVYLSRLSVRIEASGDKIGEDIFGPTDIFAVADIFGGINDSQWDVTVEYRVTDDDPTGSPTWSNWSELVTSDISGRAFEFRAKLESFQFDINIRVNSLEITIDMQDRVLAGNDLVVPVAGSTIVFEPAYRELQGIAIAAQGLQTGDTYEITDKTKSGFTIQFKNASGSPVERTMDYVAKGYGEQNT